jgi:glycosyltransferase involved in cell wall biosynthesis
VSDPKVTIGTVVYNERPHLEPALATLANQTFDDYEIVVCDDASTDGSGEICRAFAEGDPRVRYRRNETNRGSVYTFNDVLERARGEYFVWAAGHDRRSPAFLSTCVSFLDENPDVALCHTAVDVVDGEDRTLTEIRDHVDARQPDTYERVRSVLWQMAARVSVDPMYGLFRTDVLQATGGHWNVWGPDNRVVLATALEGGIAFLPEPLFQRRINRQPSPSLLRHVRDYFTRLDPDNASRSKATYLALLAAYVETIREADLDPWDSRRLVAHAMASLLAHYPGEIIAHDVVFCGLAKLVGETRAEQLLAPLDWLARKIRYASHPSFPESRS